MKCSFIKNKIYIRVLSMLLSTVLLLCSVKSYVSAESVREGDLYSLSAVLMDADTGRVLYEKDGYNRLPNASTTKIMTCIVALEYGNIDDIVTISQNAASQPKVHLGMASGQQYKLGDLLYSLMLESHNDSAVAIAEHVGGSVAQFADLMNQKARDIGCTDTYFITPNGLDAEVVTEAGEAVVHSTSARDLARIMMYCIKESPKSGEFLGITRTVNFNISEMSGKLSRSLVNHNAFLNMMDGALSGKTGFTSKAGYCYVGALTRDGKTFVVALLGCGWPNNKTYKWSDTRKLIQYGLDEYTYYTFSAPKDVTDIKQVLVKNGKTNLIGEEAAAGIMIKETPFSMLMREDESVKIEYNIEPYLTAPIEEDKVVGEIRYLVDDMVVKLDTIVTTHEVERIDYRWCSAQIWELFLP